MSKDAYKLVSPDGAELEIPVRSGTLGPDVLDIGRLFRERGVFTYDPGYMATGSCDSEITFIDGSQGVLLYRGYPIEQLAKRSNFLEVAYLLLHGELPTVVQLRKFDTTIRTHTMLNEGMLRFFTGFRYDAHPMAVLSAVVGSMSAYYHDTMNATNARQRDIFAHRILAKLPTIAAAAYKLNAGQPFVYPRNDLSYTENMLHMFFAVPAEPYEINEVGRGSAGPVVHIARRPRTELLYIHRSYGRQFGRESVLGNCCRNIRALGSGAWRSERGRAAYAS